MNKKIKLLFFLIIFLNCSFSCYAAQTLFAQKIEEAPVVDGISNEQEWKNAQVIVTHDKVADIDITLRALYTDQEIFFLVSFPDPDESRTHKSWVWDEVQEIYRIGSDREDIFIFKWNIEEIPCDLSIYADNHYKADIWFWKACRTDPLGFSDDKVQILSIAEIEDSVKLTSKRGVAMYLLRKGDRGEAVYKTKLPVEYEGDMLPRFTYQIPSGSRADIRAKGFWQKGIWTIEFARSLNTGNNDDVQFDITKSFQFGVSRYEIAGREPNPKLTQPLYGCGDVSEELILVFSQ
jgi:hypothetical protein